MYDPKRKRYLFLAYLFAAESRHRRPLKVNDQLFDVNNPSMALTTSNRPSIARLFELEFDTHQQRQLDQARTDAEYWKDAKHLSSGALRATTLHAHFSKERQEWWFEVHLSLGIRPKYHLESQHIIGIHIDPISGWYVTISQMNGTQLTHFALNEARIAILLDNRFPEKQACISPNKRTSKEQHHRIADALVALCQQYQAQLGVENISYLSKQTNSAQQSAKAQRSRSIVELIPYKLARLNLPPLVDIRGIAPKRDCGRCGARQAESAITHSVFECMNCGQQSERHANTAQETVRQTLWHIAQHRAPKQATALLAA